MKIKSAILQTKYSSKKAFKWCHSSYGANKASTTTAEVSAAGNRTAIPAVATKTSSNTETTIINTAVATGFAAAASVFNSTLLSCF